MRVTLLIFVEAPEQAPKPAETPASLDISHSQLLHASTIGGGSMSSASGVCEDVVQFVNGAPAYKGNRIFRCFKNRGNGLLFRIVNDDDFRWAFYNDMSDYTMYVTATFGANSHISPLDNTTMEVNEKTGEKVLKVKIDPRATEMFLDGVPKGFHLSCEARPIPRSECLANNLQISDTQVTSINLQGISDEDSQPQDSAAKMEPRVLEANASVE